MIAAGVAMVLLITAGTIATSMATSQSQAEEATRSAVAAASADASRTKAAHESFWSQVAADNAAQYASQRAQASAFNAAQAQDRELAAKGWQPLLEGVEGIYWGQIPNGYNCNGEAGPCQKFLIGVTRPCPGGVYIEAGIYSGAVAIGRTNDWTAALKPGDQALVTLVDLTRRGDQIKVTGATCH